MARENGHKRGDSFLHLVEEALERLDRRGALDMPHRLLLASIWTRIGLTAPAVLEVLLEAIEA